MEHEMEKPTQQQMADLIGISQAHLSRIFKTGVAGRRTYEKLAQLIGGKWTDYADMSPKLLERVVRGGIGDNVIQRPN